MKIKNISKIFILMILIMNIFSISVLAETTRIENIGISLVNQDPDPAIAGSIVEVRLGIENTGGVTADDVVIEVVPMYPFEAVDSEDYIIEVGSLGSYQEDDNIKIIKFQLAVDRDAVAGEYNLDILRYENGQKAASSIGYDLSISVGSQENAEIAIDKVELLPGKLTDLVFTINNAGASPMRELTFTWSNNDDIVLPVGSSNTRYIKYLDVGESVDMTYGVMADSNADSGLYKLELELSYENPNTGETKIITNNAGIYVGGSTDFDISYSDNSDGEYSFTIANVGNNDATSVSISVPNQDGWSTSGSNSEIIGNLDKGDYTIASFEMFAQSKTSTVELDVTYTDTKGERVTITKEVSLGLTSSGTIGTMPDGISANGSFERSENTGDRSAMRGPGASMNGISNVINIAKYIGIGIILFIMGIFGFKLYKKKKSKLGKK